MNDNQSRVRCALGCWALAVGAAIVAAAALMVIGDWRLIQAIFAALVITFVVGPLLQWTLCRPLPEMGRVAASKAPPNPVPSSKESAKAAAAQAREGAMPEPQTRPAAAAAAAAAGVKPSKALPGEAELASRKGSWSYQAGGSAKPAADEGTPAADVGTKPQSLSEPREGGADDLKQIKGVGPKLEQLCHRLGFYHFDQIANWTADEVAWVDANLEGFKGRVTRDNWVDQAKVLAGGGETEFSKRVEDGDVYGNG